MPETPNPQGFAGIDHYVCNQVGYNLVTNLKPRWYKGSYDTKCRIVTKFRRNVVYRTQIFV